MTTPSRPAPESAYALRPQTPVRAWLLASVLVVAGVVVAYLGFRPPRNTVIAVIGIVAGVAGILLGLLAATFVAARTQYVTLTDSGFDVSGPRYHRSGTWDEVTAVNATPDGSRLVISCGLVTRVFIQAPGGNDPQMAALTDDIVTRLGHHS